MKNITSNFNNNECSKRNNKVQCNNECIVSRMVVDWKMFTFCLGSQVSQLFFFLFELFED